MAVYNVFCGFIRSPCLPSGAILSLTISPGFSSPKELFLVIRSGLFFRLHGNELNVDHGIHMDLCQIEGAVVSARCSVDVDAAH